jgi:hypothetical protein
MKLLHSVGTRKCIVRSPHPEELKDLGQAKVHML